MNKINLKEIPIKFNDVDEAHQHLMLIDYVWTEVPGCTTVAGLYQQDGWKFAWPVKLMYEYLLSYVEKRLLIEEVDLKKAKGLWREKRDKAADSGNIAHKWIETYIKEGKKTEFPTDKDALSCVGEFLVWESEYKPEWLASEVQVGSVQHQFCGILDAVAVINGKKVLLDFKTSSDIKPYFNIQLAGLWMCLVEQGFEPEERAILHLPKGDKHEYRTINTSLSFEQECFLSGLKHLRHKNMFMTVTK